jgi:hypothetical protein
MPALHVAAQRVTQDELEDLIGLRNQVRHLRRLIDRQSNDILHRLLAGAAVECGTHVAEVQERCRGAAKVVRVFVQ